MTRNVEAFMAYYDATCDAAYRLACCLTRDAETAGDAVTRAYVRAYRSGLNPRMHGQALILGLVRDELPEFVTAIRRARQPQLEAS